MFVENAPFEGMVADITHEPWTLPTCGPAPGPRHCPACDQRMMVEAYGDAVIDRCPAHGIWFDETELATALASTSPPARSIGGWLKRLFFGPR